MPVAGVGAEESAAPPVGTVYQFNVAPVKLDAVNLTGVAFWQ